ncbi:MAG: hypothetical protein E6J39_06660 [Chloroflexi bacterium]|nr:MAG: hypothetical protein E6J39_06660 [Chloroflexota bacterium]
MPRRLRKRWAEAGDSHQPARHDEADHPGHEPPCGLDGHESRSDLHRDDGQSSGGDREDGGTQRTLQPEAAAQPGQPRA